MALIFRKNQPADSASSPLQEDIKGKMTSITIIIPTDAYFLSGIRDFTLSLTKNMTGFSDQWAYRFQSVVDELCNNAIEHGSAKGQDVKIVFQSKVGEFIDVSVEDKGTGPVKIKAEELAKLVEERSNPAYIQHLGVRGRGLVQIVANWSDELEFTDRPGGGLIVRARKYLKTENDPGKKSATVLSIVSNSNI